jgi:hypothetical protein
MNRIFPYVVLGAAFVLAGSAAYYSVFGLSKLFSSQALAIIILAGSLEASKLITASYLHRYWAQITWSIRTYLMIAVFILMCITSLGIYGFLVSAYQDTAYRFENQETIIKNLESKKSRFDTQLQQVTTEKDAVTDNVNKLTAALSNNVIQYTDRKGNQVIKTSSENRKAYETQLASANLRVDELGKKQTALSDSVTRIDMQILDMQTNSDVAAEIGPLKYIAEITGSTMDRVVNWLIILLIIVFDPLAIVLLISANKALGFTNSPTVPTEPDPIIPTPIIKSEIPETEIIEPDPIVEPEPEVIPEPEPVLEEPPKQTLNPEILSYWNKIRNERSKKYK